MNRPLKIDPLIGVLALQGDFREHMRALEGAGARARSVRIPRDLAGLDGLVIPGGESTTLQILLERNLLWEPLRARIASGLPTLATCAGMILLARRIVDGRPGQRGLGVLDIEVRRNGYGRQLDSFEAPVQVDGIADPFPGVFIRAPVVEKAGGVDIHVRHLGRPVGVRRAAIVGLCFHPELTGDLRIHRSFVQLAGSSTIPHQEWPPVGDAAKVGRLHSP